jgi:hypothetical protein
MINSAYTKPLRFGSISLYRNATEHPDAAAVLFVSNLPRAVSPISLTNRLKTMLRQRTEHFDNMKRSGLEPMSGARLIGPYSDVTNRLYGALPEYIKPGDEYLWWYEGERINELVANFSSLYFPDGSQQLLSMNGTIHQLTPSASQQMQDVRGSKFDPSTAYATYGCVKSDAPASETCQSVSAHGPAANTAEECPHCAFLQLYTWIDYLRDE